MQQLPGDDARLTFCGAIDVVRADGTATPLRLPAARMTLFPFVDVPGRYCAGVRVTFRTDARRLHLHVVGTVPDSSPVDLVVDGQRLARAPAAGQSCIAFDALPDGDKHVEIWLPQFGPLTLTGVGIDDEARLHPWRPAGRRWLTCGSSITQCRQADGPTETWPALVARRLGLDHINLGFGGQCHLDPMLARLIRDTPAEAISICCGINIYGAASLGPRAFLPAILGTIATIREKHPATPLLLISPIFGCQRETQANPVGFTLPMMRQEVARAAEILQNTGDAHLRYLDGLDLLGPDDARHLPDGLHPDNAGYALIARRFAQLAGPFLTPGQAP